MSLFQPSLAGVPRHELEARYAALERDHRQALANLTAVQSKCTAQLLELRHYRSSGLCLPGWWCQSCGAFNGSAKETRAACRACEAPKPGGAA